MQKQPTYNELLLRCELLETDYIKLRNEHNLAKSDFKELSDINSIFSQLKANLAFPFYLKDSQGRYVAANMHFARDIIGTTQDKIIGNSPHEIFAECSANSFNEDAHIEDIGLITQCKSLSSVIEVRCYDGILRRYIVNKSIITDEFGNGTHLLGLMLELSVGTNVFKKQDNFEKRYKMLFDNVGDAIVLIKDEVCVEANPRALDLFQITREQMIGKNFWDFVPELQPDGTESKLAMSKIIEQTSINGLNRFTWLNRRYDGSPFFSESTISFIEIDNERYTLAVIRDISVEKEIRERLSDSQERLSMVVEATNDGFWDWDLVSNKTYFSDRYYTMLGYEKGDFPANYEGWKSIIYQEDLNRIEIELKNHLDNRSDSFEIEFRCVCKDKSLKWIAGRGKVMTRNEQGVPLRILGMHTDIDYKKQREYAIIKMNEVLELKVKERTVELEKALSELNSEIEYRNRTLEELEFINDELQKSRKTIQEETILLSELNDKLVSSESNLQNINNSKDKLFSIIANDLRSPLSGLINISELLLASGNKMSRDEHEHFLKLLNSSSKDTLERLENLLQWSRSQLGLMPMNKSIIAIKGIIDNSVKLLAGRLKEKNIGIINKVPYHLKALFDNDTIDLVMRNLLSNAIKFSYRDSDIEISSDVMENEVVINIRDNGVGIRDDNKQLIFNRNEYFHTNGTLNEVGSGLGLILSKDFVEMNSGRIWFESTYGKGSVFHFLLPTK